jgi:hypothetical protein
MSKISSRITYSFSKLNSFDELCSHIRQQPHLFYSVEQKVNRFGTPYLLIHIPIMGEDERYYKEFCHASIYQPTWDGKAKADKNHWGEQGQAELGPHSVHMTVGQTPFQEHYFYRLFSVPENSWQPGKRLLEFVLFEVFGLKCRAKREFH